jgi:hypothetical protein
MMLVRTDAPCATGEEVGCTVQKITLMHEVQGSIAQLIALNLVGVTIPSGCLCRVDVCDGVNILTPMVALWRSQTDV